MINVWIDPFSEVYLNNKMFGYDKLLNRDDCLSTWRYLKKYCHERDINLNTLDLFTKKDVTSKDIYVSFNHQKNSISKMLFIILRESYPHLSIFQKLFYFQYSKFIIPNKLKNHILKKDVFEKKVLFQFEPPVVHPHVYNNIDYLSSIYDEIFLVCKMDNPKCHFFHYQQSHGNVIPEYWENVDRKFLSMILSNKKPRPFLNIKELYSERMKIINFFGETNDIDLYGFGWNESELHEIYKGPVETKFPVLSKYNFTICFENCIMPGYITDRIFDAFFAGTIPIYWGAPDIEKYIPKNSFVDMRDFKNYDELKQFLKSLTNLEIKSYKENARKYLESEEFEPFSNEHLARKFVNAIT